jgi:hypothetical protein
MGRPCVCGGSNENCRYCNGRGEIDDGLANALVAHSYRPGLQKVPIGRKKKRGHKWPSVKPPKVDTLQAQIAKVQQLSAMIFGFRMQPLRHDSNPQRVMCLKGCGASLSPRDVDRHMRRTHPPASVAQRRDPRRVLCPKGCGAQLNPQNVGRHIFHAHRIAPVSQSPNQPGVVCPKGCGVQLNPQDVDRHLRLAHVVEVVPPLPARTVAARVQQVTSAVSPQASRLRPNHFPQTEYQLCPACKTPVKVKVSNLQKHLKKVHKANPARAASKPAVVYSADDVLRETTTLVAARDKNLDATKLYAHSYRESGRFGSHLSHDGFDDESGPD